MKLRNKKTGEIVRVEFLNNWQTDDGTEIGFRECNTDIVYSYDSLAKLNAEWEDYEEPKEYWCIDWTGGVNHITVLDDIDKYEKDKKQIGNYFETEEEAEKAVEKLKAWKRLKDKGFRFVGIAGLKSVIYFCADEKYDNAHIMFDEYGSSSDDLKQYNKDLDLLFGGEE